MQKIHNEKCYQCGGTNGLKVIISTMRRRPDIEVFRRKELDGYPTAVDNFIIQELTNFICNNCIIRNRIFNLSSFIILIITFIIPTFLKDPPNKLNLVNYFIFAINSPLWLLNILRHFLNLFFIIYNGFRIGNNINQIPNIIRKFILSIIFIIISPIDLLVTITKSLSGGISTSIIN